MRRNPACAQELWPTGCTATPPLRKSRRKLTEPNLTNRPDIASPTIQEALDAFLVEIREQVSDQTYRSYSQVVGLLAHCINQYAYNTLDKENYERFNRLYDASGEAHREYCEIFGPERIVGEYGKFLNDFMIRKVFAGRGLLKAAGTVTKRLARWLHTKGWVEADKLASVVETSARASRELPRADKLGEVLYNFVQRQSAPVAEEYTTHDHFTIVDIKEDSIVVTGLMDGPENVSLRLPPEVLRHCEVGWSVLMQLAWTGRRWTIVEVGNVYPAGG